MLLHKNKSKKRKSKKTIYSKMWLLSAHETAELMNMSDVGVYQGDSQWLSFFFIFSFKKYILQIIKL